MLPCWTFCNEPINHKPVLVAVPRADHRTDVFQRAEDGTLTLLTPFYPRERPLTMEEFDPGI